MKIQKKAGVTEETGCTNVQAVPCQADSKNRQEAIVGDQDMHSREDERADRKNQKKLPGIRQEVPLLEGERIDDLERNGYKIIQNKQRFCFGMDAVLLSGFATVRPGECVLDLGTGTGIIPILLEAKTEGIHFTGLELQPEVAEMAQRSVRLNGLEEKVEIVVGDIKEAHQLFGKSVFDVVTSNPPYMIAEHGLQNPNKSRAISRHEICCTLEDVIREAASVLKPGGRLYMVHRPFRLTDLMELLRKYRLEPKRVKLVHPYVDKEANMVLIEAIRGSRARVTVEVPLIVFQEDGTYTKEVVERYGY